MTPRELKVGEIVQIDPAWDSGRGKQWFGGTLMVVTEPKSWGAQGYVQNAGESGPAYFRCEWEHMEPTGALLDAEEEMLRNTLKIWGVRVDG